MESPKSVVGSFLNANRNVDEDMESELFILASQARGEESSPKESGTIASGHPEVITSSTRDHERIEEDKASRAAPKTLAHTAWCTGVWRAWATRRLNRPREDAEERQHQLLEDFGAMIVSDLAFWMGKFILEMRRTDGGYYPADTIYSIIGGLNRSLKSSSNGGVNVLKDPHFSSTREILESERKRLRAAARKPLQQQEISAGESANYSVVEPVGLQQAGIPANSAVEDFNNHHTAEKNNKMESQESRTINVPVGNGNKSKGINVGPIAKKTLSQTAWCGRIWSAWAQQRKQKLPQSDDELKHQLLVDFHLMPVEDIGFWLGKFFLEVRRSDGNSYSPESLSNILAGLNRILKYTGRADIDLTRDPVFSDARELLDAELTRLRCSEQKKPSLAVGFEEENILWEKGLLGDHNPQVLVDTLVYYITYCFGLRGGDHRKLRHYPSQFQLFEPTGSIPFLVYSEDVSEDVSHQNKLVLYMDQANTKRCLVRLYKLYNSLCPPNRPDNAFYLRPIHQPKGYVWYESSPIGHNVLSRTIARLFQKAGLEGNYSNASLLSHFSSRLAHIGSDDQDISRTTYKIVTAGSDENVPIPPHLTDNIVNGPPQKRAKLSIKDAHQLHMDYNMEMNCEPQIIYIEGEEQENEMSKTIEFGLQDIGEGESVEMEAQEMETDFESNVNESSNIEKENQIVAQVLWDQKHPAERRLSSEVSISEGTNAVAESASSGPLAYDQNGKTVENSGVPKRTAIQTTWCTGVWKAWATARLASSLEGEDKQHELLSDYSAMSPGAMAYWLKKFILEIRKADGEPYSPDSIYSIFAGLNRSLKLAGRGEIGMLRDPSFMECRDVLEKEMSRLQATGKFQKKTSSAIGAAQENTLWAKGILGDHSPQALVDTLVYYFTFSFGIRGGDHRKLRHYPSQIQLVKSSDGTPCLVYDEDASAGGSKHGKNHQAVHNMNTDNPERCLVRMYKLYNSKCPQDRPNNAFYLRPVARLKHIDDPIWYENSPIGHNVLSRTIPRLFDEAGIEGNYSSHSVRNTSTSKLFHPDAIDQLIKTLRSTSGPPNLTNQQPLLRPAPIVVSEEPPSSASHPQLSKKMAPMVTSQDKMATLSHDNLLHRPHVSSQNSSVNASVQSGLPAHLSMSHRRSTSPVTAITTGGLSLTGSKVQSSQSASYIPLLQTPLSTSSTRSSMAEVSTSRLITSETKESRSQVTPETDLSSSSGESTRSTLKNRLSRSVKSALENQGSNLAIPEIAALIRTISPEIVSLVRRHVHHGPESSVQASDANNATSDPVSEDAAGKQCNVCDTMTVSRLKRKLDPTASEEVSCKPTQPIVLSSTGFDISIPGLNIQEQAKPFVSEQNQDESIGKQQKDAGKRSSAQTKLEASRHSPTEAYNISEQSIALDAEAASPEAASATNSTSPDVSLDRNPSSVPPDWSTSLPDNVAAILQHSGPPIIITGGLTINFNFN